MQNLEGKTMGRLYVVKRIGFKYTKNGRYQNYLCRCECGNYCERTISSLNSKGLHSCGCYKKECFEKVAKMPTKARISHGMSNTRLYKIHESMKMRCRNKNSNSYTNYGGRGIDVCKEWERFEPFAEWAMQSGYNDELTIDRIDNNKGYSPDNCRWATRRNQMENTRRTRKYTIDGETHSITYWARKYGISRSTLFYRLERGMGIEEALTSHGKRRQVGDCD